MSHQVRLQERLGPYDYQCWQGVFPLGGDSLALGAFATVRKGWRVWDLGTGSGLLLLLLAAKAEGLYLNGIDLNALAVENARHNLSHNGLEGTILSGDLREAALPWGQADLVVVNPPYFVPGSGAPSWDKAREEQACDLAQLCACAGRLLKNGGRLALVHRPERLVDIMLTMRTYHIEPKRMKTLAHNPKSVPSGVLVEGVKQGKPGGLRLEPGN